MWEKLRKEGITEALRIEWELGKEYKINFWVIRIQEIKVRVTRGKL